MDIQISGHHIELTDAIRHYVEEKLTRLTRHFEWVDHVEAMLKIEGSQQYAEFVTHVRRAPHIVVHATGKDMYAAVDMAADKLERRLRRQKEKRLEKRQRTKTSRSVGPEVAEDSTPQPDEGDEQATP